MSALEIQHMHRKGNKIAMITAYDYPSVRYVAAYDVIVHLELNLLCSRLGTLKPQALRWFSWETRWGWWFSATTPLSP
jgi:hypothetical protein